MSFIVSVHIPKTAGTTFASVLDRCFQRRILFEYDDYSRPGEPDPRIVANRDFVSSYFKAVHGHFFGQRYFDVFPDADFVSVVRHPVERIISQYLHEMNDTSPAALYHTDIASGRMSVVDFSEIPDIKSCMSNHLRGRDLADYSVIMLSENMPVSLRLFCRKVQDLSLETHFGVSGPFPHLNSRRDRPLAVEITDAERSAIFMRTTEDNELYRRAEELFQQDAQRYLG